MPIKGKVKSIINKLDKKYLIAMIVLELLLCAILVLVASTMVSLNRHDKIIYNDKAQQDNITCTDGHLIVNNVDISVPNAKNLTYNISYSWAETDTEYPTVPKAITASYKDDAGTPLYDISLYRESFTPSSEIPASKTAETWFNDWKVVDEPNMKSGPKAAGDIKGFSITTLDAEEASELKSTAYLTDTFYFTVKEKDGISVYVIEGILYHSGLKDNLVHAMNSSIESITIKKDSGNKKKENAQAA